MQHIPHATSFYVVHRLFSGAAFPRGPVWGSLSDGPYDKTEALDCISDSFSKEAPTLATLYVLHVQDDVPARDVTEDIIAELAAEREPTEEEAADQRACDDADDYAHLMAEGRAA